MPINSGLPRKSLNSVFPQCSNSILGANFLRDCLNQLFSGGVKFEGVHINHFLKLGCVSMDFLKELFIEFFLLDIFKRRLG